MKNTFKKYNIGEHHYYFKELGDYVALVNSESYHAPIEKYLNRWFCYYIYEKVEGWDVADYVKSYDYDDLEILPTLRECEQKADMALLYHYK